MEMPGFEHLCEVTVTYPNDERKVMWYAEHDSQFCSEKTEELKGKYESKWNYQCEQWPDHDGIDQLSDRQRTILDAELKSLIQKGKDDETPFLVEGLKAAGNPTTNEGDTSLLVVQFFLHAPDTGNTSDITHIINDNGVSWNTFSKIETLADYIDANEGYVVNSALISNITDNGAMEIITVLDSATPAQGDEQSFSGCYGNQTLAAKSNGDIVARTPHRYFCPEGADDNAG